MAADDEPERLLLDDDVLLVTLAPDDLLLLFTLVLLVFTVVVRLGVALRTLDAPEVAALLSLFLTVRLTAELDLFVELEPEVLILDGWAEDVLVTTGMV